jgi:hypothetical protein
MRYTAKKEKPEAFWGKRTEKRDATERRHRAIIGDDHAAEVIWRGTSS